MSVEVDDGFYGDHLDREFVDRGRGKRALESTFGSQSSVAKRQLAWLQKDSGDSKKAVWRPVKFHRVAARKFCVRLDNQIKTSTCRQGLNWFKYDGTRPEWSSWRTWPGVTLCIDLGSDGVCAYHELSRHFDVNVWMFPDQAHSCQRSFIGVLRETKQWELWLLMLVVWNLEFGPRLEESRRAQLRAALGKVYVNLRPEER